MKLLAIGRLKASAERDLLTRYCDRLRPKLEIIEFPQTKKSPAEQKHREADLLLAACPAHAFVIVLDEGGRNLDSLSFSTHYQQWQESGRPVYFIIGGAEGLEARVLSRADIILSFGTMTWPHMLVRILLVEQIFRAQAIQAGHPYHRADRPK